MSLMFCIGYLEELIIIMIITKLTIKSYLQLMSLKSQFRQSTIYIIPFDLKKKRHLISDEKNHSIKIYHIFGKKFH